MRVAAALLSALLLAALAGPAAYAQPAARPPAQNEPKIPMRYVRTDLRQILQRVAPLLGERIIYDTALSGRVTIAVPRPVSRSEAWELLHAALALRGFVATPVASGGYKIIPMPEATASDPWTLAAPIEDGESRIVTLLSLRHVAVQELRDILAPLLDPQTLAIPTSTGNSLILATTQRRLSAIIRLAHELDVRPLRDLEIATLSDRDASFVAGVLRTRYDDERGGRPIVEVWVDERTNSVLYRAPRAMLVDVRAVIDQLDQPSVGGGEIEVIGLRYADPQDIAQRLQALSAAPNATGPRAASGLAGAQLNIVAEPSTASLVVNAAPETLQRVRSIVRLLDQPPRQVVIDAVAIEWVHDDTSELRFVGVTDYTLPGGVPGTVQLTPTGFNSTDAAPVDSFTADVTRGLSRFQVVAEAVGTEGRTLMRPHLLALSGEEQVFFSGNEIPVETAAPAAEGRSNRLRQRRNIERREVGIELKVRPTVGADFDTHLEVEVSIEAIGDAALAGATGPVFTQTDIHTVAQLKPGAALVIGTFSKPFKTESRLGVPFLMNLPFLGKFFSQTVTEQKKSQVLIAIQARPLPDSRARIANSIRRRAALERAISRERTLPEASSGAFALRIASENERRSADELAQRFDSELHPANVMRWHAGNDETAVYDVQLLGFETYEAAAEEAFRLYGEGFDSDILVLAGASDLLD